MTATAIPSMIIDDVDLRSHLGILTLYSDPFACGHVWEPHSGETGRAYCSRCGSFARWVNDPRVAEEAGS